MAERSPLVSVSPIGDDQLAAKGRRKVVRMFAQDSSSDEGVTPEPLAKIGDDCEYSFPLGK